MNQIILDTDIGSDIDDSFVLAYLLNKEDVQLKLISTVSAQSSIRCELAAMLAAVKAKPLKIISGSENDLKGGEMPQNRCEMANLAGGFQEFGSDYIEEIYNTLANEPGQIDLLAIGPLTNIAKLLMVHPDALMLAKALTVMGTGTKGSLEWNIYNDPRAAEIVFRARHRKLVIFPSDMTMKVFSHKSYLKDHLTGSFADLLNKMANNWFERDHEYFHYHDPLAAVSILKPQLFDLEAKTVVYHNGTFKWSPFGQEVFFANSCDEEAFLEELYQVINS